MRKSFVVHTLLLFLFVSFFAILVDARSGCCSYHNGVRADGCGCNDGTPLSSTCAPYYRCNSSGNSINSVPTVQKIYVPPTNRPLPTWTPVPTKTPTPKPTKSILRVTPKKVTKKANSKKITVKKKTFWQLLFNK